MICPYCQKEAIRTYGDKIYPHRPDLYKKKFYACMPCKAYVGCHQTNDERFLPLGRLANANLRKLKMQAHASFDPLWKSGRMTRADAYFYLSRQLQIGYDACHIGMFDEKLCLRTIELMDRLNTKAG